jgi:hypothetical protein
MDIYMGRIPKESMATNKGINVIGKSFMISSIGKL